MRRAHFTSVALLLGACAVPTAIDCLDETSPPPELGRPMWVRVCAGTGAWIGGIVGGVASIVALPITYPLSLLCEDGLGEHAANEFMLFPAIGGAAFGHAVLGTPPDILDYVFRRAWIGTDPAIRYDYVPLEPPIVPRAERPRAGDVPADVPADAPAAEPAPTERGGQR